MLDANLKKQLDTYLQHIVNPIEISVSVDESPKGKELHELAVEIAEMSGKIGLVSADDKRTPSMAVGAAGETPRIRFAGLPCPSSSALFSAAPRSPTPRSPQIRKEK